MSDLKIVIFFILTVLIGACGRTETKSLADKPEMVWIPGGDFVMGTDEELAYDHERPAHKVQVKGFWMSATEVTNR